MTADHFNRLSPAELELLAMLSEEAGEIVQIVGKILRHGYESRHPDHPVGGTNREELGREIGDLQGVVDEMVSRGSLSQDDIRAARLAKMRHARKYMHHAAPAEGRRP